MRPLSGEEVAWAAELACVYEVGIEKPGNVSRHYDFGDARYEDFVTSAVALGPAFRDAGRAAVGETILRAVTDTRRLVATNTNLGIVLLLAPLAKAACVAAAAEGLQAATARVVSGLTVADARNAYEAIRRAAPAGLGRVAEHDVGEAAPTATLREAMASARGRDSIAAEYAGDFEITFTVGYEALRRSWDEGGRFSEAIRTTFLTILARVPDTLIRRKSGMVTAAEVSRRAAEVLEAGGYDSPEGTRRLVRLRRYLRDADHARNPGTTADLVCASLFVFLTEGGMLERLPDLSARW